MHLKIRCDLVTVLDVLEKSMLGLYAGRELSTCTFTLNRKEQKLCLVMLWKKKSIEITYLGFRCGKFFVVVLRSNLVRAVAFPWFAGWKEWNKSPIENCRRCHLIFFFFLEAAFHSLIFKVGILSETHLCLCRQFFLCKASYERYDSNWNSVKNFETKANCRRQHTVLSLFCFYCNLLVVHT